MTTRRSVMTTVGVAALALTVASVDLAAARGKTSDDGRASTGVVVDSDADETRIEARLRPVKPPLEPAAEGSAEFRTRGTGRDELRITVEFPVRNGLDILTPDTAVEIGVEVTLARGSDPYARCTLELDQFDPGLGVEYLLDIRARGALFQVRAGGCVSVDGSDTSLQPVMPIPAAGDTLSVSVGADGPVFLKGHFLRK